MRVFKGLLVSLAILLSTDAVADSCPNSGLLSTRMFDSICWDCLFPMKVAGVTIDPPSGDGSGSRPSGSLSGNFCSCPGPFEIPEFGVTYGAWMPKFVTETVQKPYCSPGLAGQNLGGKTRLATGGDIRASRTQADQKKPDSAFLHFHTFSFPVLEMLELFMEGGCDAEGYVDIELQYISEPDPLWSDALLSAILAPEGMLFANPGAQMLCSAECTELSASNTSNDVAHWCAGCWGNVYPFNGTAWHGGDRVQHSSLVATKALAALHRRLLAFKSYGSDAACGERQIAPVLNKEQYRFGMFYPSPETSGNHKIGRSTMIWGRNRNKSSAGSNHVYIGYRYQDCCLR